MGDVIVLTVLGVIIALVIGSMWKAKKKNKSCGCSCGCEHCSYNCSERK